MVGFLVAVGYASIGRAWAAVPPITSAILTSARTTQPVVALTFDDGPSSYTAHVLSILQSYHAHATFFVVGVHVGQYPSILRSTLAEGDELGNHTYTHADLLRLSDGGIATELLNTQSAVRRATGFTPHWFRPPYGAVDGRVSGMAASLGLRTATWNADPRDWALPGTGNIAASVVAQAHPGGIVIMHDGGGFRGETVAALPEILATLRARGYRFVTMSQLFGLPWTSMCHPKRSAREFSRDGIPVHSHRTIYGAWAERLCDGANLGPATSREHRVRPGVMAQDFLVTGHRIVWNMRTGEIRVRELWSVATTMFSGRGIRPRRHWAITHAWFRAFFEGRNWGPALAPPALGNGFTWQRFERGDAVSVKGTVIFHAR